MVKIEKYFFQFLLFFLISFSGESQTVASLEKKIKSIQKDIKLAEHLLKETAKDKENTLNQVSLLQAQIKQREKLIKTYQSQINLIEKDIQKNKKEIHSLQKDLEMFRKEYANLLLISYRNRNKINSFIFIFSSKDFNQALKRVRYIQQLNGLVQKKIQDIDSTQIKINIQLEQNEKKKKEKEIILANEKKEKESLVNDKEKLNNQVARLKKKEKQIQKDISTKNKETQNLKKQIENIIAEEIRKAKEREEKAKKNNIKSIDYELSDNFVRNKGKFPWPVKEGIITGKYGLNQHPTQKKVTVNNNGIDITVPKDSKARAIFDGEVSIVSNQGSKIFILIRHGFYFTLYSGLDKAYVKKGDKVSTKEEIGHIHTNASDNKTVLHFELWQENKTTMDPSIWLSH